MNKSKILINSLVASSIISVGVGAVVLGAGFDSWEQSNAVEQLSKYSNLSPKVKELFVDVEEYNKYVDVYNGKLENIDSQKTKINSNFPELLNIIFNGIEYTPGVPNSSGPMWNNWNQNLSQLMSNPKNKKFASIKLNDSFNELLKFSDPDPKYGQPIINAMKSIKEIQPVLKDLGLVTESRAGFIVGIVFLSITSIPLLTLVALCIKNKYFKENSKE